jgi:NADPH:quinone reductase-like Zn-dependent oxidoreductase
VRAVRIHEEGGPEVVLVDRDVPVPEPGPGEARVRMRASALNHIDIWIRLGKPSRPKPHTLGADGAGVVDELGPGTEGPEPGTEVVINPGLFCGACAACLRGQQSLCERFAVLGEHAPGAHADYCVVPVRNLHPKPGPLSWAEAAAYPLVFATAWRMLMTRARLQPGEWVLVWGAGSGVGSAAVTLASSLGARVIATASRDEVLAVARERGAVATINHRGDDVLAAVKEITGGLGVDVVYEHVGADTWATSIEALCRGGRLVLTGATTGGNPPARLHRIFWKQLDVLGSTMASDSEFRAVTRLFAQGRIRPLVDSVRPLEDVQDAQRQLEAGEQNGKLVLEISNA